MISSTHVNHHRTRKYAPTPKELGHRAFKNKSERSKQQQRAKQ